jgi:hypothetical protein
MRRATRILRSANKQLRGPHFRAATGARFFNYQIVVAFFFAKRLKIRDYTPGLAIHSGWQFRIILT